VPVTFLQGSCCPSRLKGKSIEALTEFQHINTTHLSPVLQEGKKESSIYGKLMS
jgi:hypothetical protein